MTRLIPCSRICSFTDRTLDIHYVPAAHGGNALAGAGHAWKQPRPVACKVEPFVGDPKILAQSAAAVAMGTAFRTAADDRSLVGTCHAIAAAIDHLHGARLRGGTTNPVPGIGENTVVPIDDATSMLCCGWIVEEKDDKE